MKQLVAELAELNSIAEFCGPIQVLRENLPPPGAGRAVSHAEPSQQLRTFAPARHV